MKKMQSGIFYKTNASGADYALVSGISPAATSLRSWTAAGLKVLHEAIFCDAKHRMINFF